MSLLNLCRQVYIPRTLLSNLSDARFHTLRRLDNIRTRNTLKYNEVQVTPKRNFFWIFKKLTKREARAKDKVPDSYILIYRNSIDNYMQATHLVLLCTNIAAAALCLTSSGDYFKMERLPILEEKGLLGIPLKPIDNQLTYILVCFVVLASVTYLYSSRMPVRIYYNAQKANYICCFNGFFPNQLKKQIVKIGEIAPLFKKETIFPFGDVTYRHLNGYRLILFDNYFRKPSDLYVMLGEQLDPNVKYEKVQNKK